MKIRATILLLMILVLSAGCHKNVITNLPPGVSQTEVSNWYEATGAVKTFSDVAVAGPKVVVTLVNTGVVDKEYEVAALKLFGTVDQVGIHIANILKQSPNSFNTSTKAQISTELQTLIVELQKFNTEGGTHIKNPSSMSAFNNILGSLNISVQLLQSITGGK